VSSARNSPIPIDRVRENIPHGDLAQDDNQTYSEQQSRLAREEADNPPETDQPTISSRGGGGGDA
jgi:hypothetical protein